MHLAKRWEIKGEQEPCLKQILVVDKHVQVSPKQNYVLVVVVRGIVHSVIGHPGVNVQLI